MGLKAAHSICNFINAKGQRPISTHSVRIVLADLTC